MKIDGYLREYIAGEREHQQPASVKPFGVYDRLLDFTSRGKMIRGGLAHLAYSLYIDRTDPGLEEEIVKLGAVFELLQSALLIHDDIMDKDEMRRGSDTIYYQYVSFAREKDGWDAYHTGEAMGICSGDIAFFLAFNLLSSLRLPPDIHREICLLSTREMIHVGSAQMIDVYWGTRKNDIGEADVLDLYRYKTGRYTYALPFKAGAIIAGAPGEECGRIEKIGEELGIVFQIVDDELGLFGSEEKVGKPVGSDIREGKKTLHMLSLLHRASPDERKKVLSILGNPGITGNDIELVRSLMVKHGVRETIREKIKAMTEEVWGKTFALDMKNPLAGDILRQLIKYNMERVF